MKLSEKTLYDKLVTQLNNIDNSGFVLQSMTQINQIQERKSTKLTKKILDNSGLVKKTQL